MLVAVLPAPRARSSWPRMGDGWTGTVLGGPSAGSPAAPGSPSRRPTHPAACLHHPGPGCRGPFA